MLGLKTKVSELNKIAKALSNRLKYLEIETVSDLIFYYPFRYENYLNIPIDKLKPGDFAMVRGTVETVNNKKTRFNRKNIVEVIIFDGHSSIKAVWFNQPWVAKNIRVGQELCLSGKVAGAMFDIYFNSPNYSQDNLQNGIMPVYPLTAGITQKQLRLLSKQALEAVEIIEYLPEEILEKEKLLPLAAAIYNIHFPANEDILSSAKRRLSFDELFLVQAACQFSKKEIGSLKATPILFDEKSIKKFVQTLDFDLTLDQKKAAWEIIKDLERSMPMNRMIEGDVGSGKTIVAFMAALNVAKSKHQSAMMAPTEILATQHYQSALKIFKKEKINIALLCRAQKSFNGQKIAEKELLQKIKSGEVDLIIGTHALIQNKIIFKNLALVIVDEQHRFGVEQRQALKQKSNLSPHFLSLTATPIPRSLALISYGDLDISIIAQMPKGRVPITTKVVEPQNRNSAYEFIKKQISSGRQIFVICPLIDPSDTLGVRSVNEEFQKLDKEIFPNINVGILHGRMKSDDKEEVMKQFKDNKIKILVSTSVVEVGIDIANATVMMIEGAERFGLAQLHQFRGRVGRGEHQSYCFLFSDNFEANAISRLKYMEDCQDGFKLANYDLELRGSGSVFSTQQSGYADFKIADIKDIATVKKAQDWAKWCVEKADEKTLEVLKEKISSSGFTMHRE